MNTTVNPGETKTPIAESMPEKLPSGEWETSFAQGDAVTVFNGKPIGDDDEDARLEVTRHNIQYLRFSMQERYAPFWTFLEHWLVVVDWHTPY